MYKIIDDFYTLVVFNRILDLVREFPINQVPENYDGKRYSYGNIKYN